MSERSLLPLKKVRIDGGTQMRDAFNQELILDLAEAIKAGETVPDAVVFFDGISYWLADGFHRLQAYEKAGKGSMPCEIRLGNQREAILYAAGANSSHGQRRSPMDKRRAIVTLLQDEEWKQKSDRWIAEICHVSHPTVADVRRELEEESSTGNSSSSNSGDSEQQEKPKREGRDRKKRGYKKPVEIDLRCESCKRKGAHIEGTCPGCKATKAAYLAKKGRKRGKRAEGNGQVVVQFKDYEKPLGQLIRWGDEILKQHGVMKTPLGEGLRRQFKELLAGIEQFGKDIKKLKKEK